MQLFYDLERSSHNMLVIEEEHGALAVLPARSRPRICRCACTLVFLKNEVYLLQAFTARRHVKGPQCCRPYFNVVSPVPSMSAKRIGQASSVPAQL